MKTKLMLAAVSVALGGTIALALAQEKSPSAGPICSSEDGQDFHHRPPPNLIFKALDANHDGVIDAGEQANAPTTLKQLDKNGDGRISLDEIQPPPPPRFDSGSGGDTQGGGDGGNPPSGPPPVDN